MLKKLWSRIAGHESSQKSANLEIDTLDLVSATHLASDLRNLLLVKAKIPGFVKQQVPILVKKMQGSLWPESEVEKVLAYVDFFSGANASGYQRVMQHSLAKQDYMLFMTACIHCYLADKFAEGAALLDMFQPHEDPSTDWCEYLTFASYIYFTAGRPVEVYLSLFDNALDRGCSTPMLVTNATLVYFEAGRHDHCNRLTALIQTKYFADAEAITATAYIELARDYYPEGFRLMEVRYQLPDLSRAMKISLLQCPRWDKQSLAGRRLLVHGEQGLGDMLMMVRYLPLLQAQGATLLMDGRSEAASLIKHNFPDCEFIVGDLQAPINLPFDFWTGIMSLPYHFATTAFNVPGVSGYLVAPKEQQVYWRDRVQELSGVDVFRVGLAWSGNPGHRADKRRSMPFELMATLVQQHPDIQFFSLQTHVPELHPTNLIDIADELLTLADTAAAIMEMDMVISVDTSAIHLAGALGRSALLLLPHRYEWRWGLEGEENSWYESVRVLRQKQSGDWSALIKEVSKCLMHEVKRKSGDFTSV